MSETKRRLLISKWRGELTEQAEEIAKLKGDLEDANDKIKEVETEQEEYQAQLEDALESVKYWLHDGLVHGKIVSDPRAMLRKVEEVLQ